MDKYISYTEGNCALRLRRKRTKFNPKEFIELNGHYYQMIRGYTQTAYEHDDKLRVLFNIHSEYLIVQSVSGEKYKVYIDLYLYGYITYRATIDINALVIANKYIDVMDWLIDRRKGTLKTGTIVI